MEGCTERYVQRLRAKCACILLTCLVPFVLLSPFPTLARARHRVQLVANAGGVLEAGAGMNIRSLEFVSEG